MSKTKRKKKNFEQIQTALFHIHSIADMIENNSLGENAVITNTENKISNSLLSLAQIIKEKAEFCIIKIDESGVMP